MLVLLVPVPMLELVLLVLLVVLVVLVVLLLLVLVLLRLVVLVLRRSAVRWHGSADVVRDLRLVLPGRRDRLHPTVELHSLLGRARRDKGDVQLTRLGGRGDQSASLIKFFVTRKPWYVQGVGKNAVQCSHGSGSDFCGICSVQNNSRVPAA